MEKQTGRTTYRKRFILGSLIAVLGLGLYAWSAVDSRRKSIFLNEQELVIDSLQRINSFYTRLAAADKVFLVDEDYGKARDAYRELLADAEESKILLLNDRIAQTERIMKRPVDNGAHKIYESIIAGNVKSIDSLKREINALMNSTGESDSLLRKIQTLSAEIAKKNSELNRKQLIQVISFKNESGRLIHYLGEVVNGKANGGGVGIWTTGSLYRGDWKDNKRHGKGTFEWADGMKYIGEFNEDKRNGTGNYYWPSGERYEGEWKNDVREGYGKLFDQDGNVKFEGRWKDDKPSR